MKKIPALDPSQWKKIDPAQPILFHAVNGNRKVQFDLNCSSYAVVLLDYDIDNDEDSLIFLAEERGMFSIEFSIAQDAMVKIEAPQGAHLYIREHLQDASYVPDKDKKKFTNPAPERTRSKHVDAVALEAKANELRREQQYALERKRYQQAHDAQMKRLAELEGKLEEKLKQPVQEPETAPQTETKQEENNDETSA